MRLKKQKITAGYILSRTLLLLLLVLSFVPMATMVNMSLKKSVMIRVDFWGLPGVPYWKNYSNALDFIFRPVLNSLYVDIVSVIFIVLFAALSGYAFGRLQFKGKKLLFGLILMVMMIPHTLLIIPNYEIINALGLINTFGALIIPYIMGGSQIMGIMLAQTFYAELPKELFEAADIDGASQFQRFIRIAFPLSKPVLITIGITSFNSIYNDYIWPTLVLTTGDKVKTFCQIVFNNATGKGANDLGLISAAFIIGTLPLLAATVFLMKYYISGITIGSIKG